MPGVNIQGDIVAVAPRELEVAVCLIYADLCEINGRIQPEP
jgi:hypothetical protein